MKRYINDVLTKILTLTLLLFAGAKTVWGQSTTDYSGTYFIANGNGYSSSNVANNYYLVPATNANYASGQPHLTTSKTGQVLNCCWRIEKSGEYYRIIHVADGKYLTANPAYSGTSGNNVGRLRVHLETMATPDDNTLFEIKVNTKGGYNIRHKDMSDNINSSTATYLDPAGGNADGTNLTSARSMSTSSGTVNVGGGIGYWSDEAAARWRFEPVPQNNTYTYNIVDRQGNIAIKYTVTNQPAAHALSSITDIPEAIRSPYLNGETVTFYTFSGDFDADNLTDENKISATPVTNNANIYVTYTTDHLSEKFLHLTEASAYNMMVNSKYIYDISGTLAYESASLTTKNYMWQMIGGDPYAVQIKNADTGNYLHYSPIDLSNSASNFILMACSTAGDDTYEQMDLLAATGDNNNYRIEQVRAYPIGFVVNYYLIDKAGKLIEGPINSTAEELSLPDEWKSPLVSEYHYFKTPGLSDGTYTPSDPVSNIFDVESGGNIYVTYDVSDAIDLTGGKTYMLRYLDGDEFYQENESDGVMTTATKGLYPYNNGDFNLYVYGEQQWLNQLAKGASTRSRWLWYVISNHDKVDLTGSNVDPYHVIIKSYQNYSLNNNTYSGSGYLRTYKPSGYDAVVTGINTKHESSYTGETPVFEPTEYMILGTSLQGVILKTFNKVEGQRRIVNSFEQYWKNNPTAYDILKAKGKTVEDEQNVNYELSDTQKAELTALGWHTYEAWANAAPWSSNPKEPKFFSNGKHWFQTINMISTGEFVLEEVSLAPQVILLDQHGWEIMRVPMYTDAGCTNINTDALNKFNSPMVETYHWYPKATKATGYHKYTVSDQKITVYDSNRKATNDHYEHNSTTLGDIPYPHIDNEFSSTYGAQDYRVKSDFYVTYTVKSTYANAYQGAATEDAVIPSAYLIKQGGNYAKYGGSGSTIGTEATKPDRENTSGNMLWNLKPNFNIDHEMGYKYAGETGAQDGAKSQAATEEDNYEEGRNGFDPYNVQIQNKAYPLRYFTTNTSASALDGGLWAGTSSTTVTLQNLGTKHTATGYDQTTLNITNATFMVVSDANGNMRLMPRFDHGKVMQSFGALAELAAAASAGDQGTGTQTLYLETMVEAKEIHNSSEITDMNGNYLLAEDFSFDNFESLGTESAPFTGIIDGQLNALSGLSKPLVAYAKDATIRNVILKSVSISQAGYVGAIACKANGTTRIYNCGILPSTITRDVDGNVTSYGSSVASTDSYCGGLVGLLDGSARVINCFSYANITSGSVKAGIVGYNNYASKYNDLKTMVMNSMFYGNITTGGSIYPIYGGNEISNDYSADTGNRLNNYNYFLYESPFSKDNTTTNPIITAYNCALAAEERFLVRFEFYRHLLNSTRELATWYVTGSADNAFSTMAKWVLDKENAPYPILKAYSTTDNPQGIYPSVVNYDPVYTFNDEGNKVKRSSVTDPNKGGIVTTLGNSGSLTINIEAGSGAKFGSPTGASINTSSITRPIVDMDFAQYNFNYGKVQLPYYNEVGTGNYTTASDGTSRVVTGWKIVSMSGGTAGGYTETNYDAPHYNYADRDHIGKDLYGTSGRIFAQGAYFNVPTGVKEITIQPYWAKCAYLSDANYDRYGYNNNDDLSDIGGGRYTNGSSYTINGVSQNVYTTFANARDAMGSTYVSGATVYDYAVVLVGNYHHKANDAAGEGDELSSDKAKPLTVTSIDLNKDNEPDYCLIFRSGKNKEVCPIRYDFITLPGMAMAHKMATHTNLAIPGNCKPYGWFEVTTTGLIKFGQFEHSWGSKTEAPLIFMGGVIDQFVANNTAGTDGNQPSYNNKTKYMLFGDNVYFELLSNGTHADNKSPTPHRPISLVGGEYRTLYLSGYFRPDANACTATSGDNNAECYIDGGKFDEVAGAGQENISGDVTWLINHADIGSFYGGGLKVIENGSQITGNISTTIKNSRVTLFCGGPKFGNVASGKEVNTTATGCVFTKFFGAGYGGTSIYRDRIQNEWAYLNYDANTTGNRDWAKWISNSYDKSTAASYRGKFTTGKGVSVGYEYEFFGGAKGNVARLYLKYASFSLAQTKNVSSTLTGCTVLEDFYGGGSFGAVDGNVTSILDNCIIKGNVFGAGYSVQTPTVDVIGLGGFTPTPNYNTTTAVFEKGNPPSSEVYTWTNSSVSNGNNALVDDNHTIKTNEAITGLGIVNGNVILTLKGSTVVGTIGDTNTGNVYGGGDASAVTGSTHKITVTLAGKTTITGNVYGGGNEGLVEGSTEVNIQQNAPE